MSKFLELLSGVPQGYILEPTLFLIFFYDLPLHLKHCLADLYAENNTIHASGKNKPESEHKLQSDANETEVWSINNVTNSLWEINHFDLRYKI